ELRNFHATEVQKCALPICAGATPQPQTPPHMVHLAPTPPIPSPKMPPGMARLRRHHHMITAGHSPNYSCRIGLVDGTRGFRLGRTEERRGGKHSGDEDVAW